MAETTLFVGGIRSGKSGLAQAWAEARSPHRLFMATLRVEDDEMQRRVARHRAARGEGWDLLECADDVVGALEGLVTDPQRPSVVVLDCLSTWIALLLERLDDTEILETVRVFCGMFPILPFDLGIVSCEVGTSLVPMHPLGRRFQDILGEANQCVAKACSTVLFVSCGLPLLIKGSQLPCPFTAQQ